MIQSQVNIIQVTSQTAQIGAFIGCTNCVGITIANINMKIYRKGVSYVCGSPAPTPALYPNCAQPPTPANGPCPTPASPNAAPPPIYFLMYPAYSLTADVVTFFIDSQLTGLCPGRYVGDIFINSKQCGSIEMNVGDECNVFTPYTVNTGMGLGNDLQPS